MQFHQMKRREFRGSVPLAAQLQQPPMPVVGHINLGTPDAMARYVAAFRDAFSEAGYVEGQNLTVEYNWLGASTIARRR
jgi:putative ABC transport system substrate-binding protein